MNYYHYLLNLLWAHLARLFIDQQALMQRGNESSIFYIKLSENPQRQDSYSWSSIS